MLCSESADSHTPNIFGIRHHPVFTKGIFENNPALFSHIHYQALSPVKDQKYNQRRLLEECEENLSWPVIFGPGFCGGTHPGAGKIFDSIMSRSRLISNNDCLYVNPSYRIFAISDAPDMSSYSRDLLTYIDRELKKNHRELEEIINNADRELGIADHATLCLLVFDTGANGAVDKAWSFVAGDSYILRGNRFNRRLDSFVGNPLFIGESRGRCEPFRIDIEDGDFFVIASDGILEARTKSRKTIEDALRYLIDVDDLYGSTLRIMQSCNEVVKDGTHSREITRLKGNDNVSILLVYPNRLMDFVVGEAKLIGGWIVGAEEWMERS